MASTSSLFQKKNATPIPQKLQQQQQQAALASRIAAEGAKSVLDTRGRLGPRAGQRKGKRVDWKSSETRLAGLLEGLCDADSLDADFAVRKREEKEETVGLSVVAAAEDDDDDVDDEVDEEEAREVLWLRRGDKETDKQGGFTRVTEEREKDYRSKQLQGWCGRLVAEVEEGLALELARSAGVGAVSSEKESEGGGSGGSGGGGGERSSGSGENAPFDARGALCERLTRSCAPGKKDEPGAAAAAAAAAAPAKKQKRVWRGKQQQQREEL